MSHATDADLERRRGERLQGLYVLFIALGVGMFVVSGQYPTPLGVGAGVVLGAVGALFDGGPEVEGWTRWQRFKYGFVPAFVVAVAVTVASELGLAISTGTAASLLVAFAFAHVIVYTAKQAV